MPADSQPSDVLERFLEALNTSPSDLRARLTAAAADPHSAVARSLNAFLNTLTEVLTAAESSILESGIAEARTRQNLKTLSQATLHQSDSVQSVTLTVAQVAAAAQEVASIAESGASHSAELKALAANGRSELDDTNRQLAAIMEHAKGMQQRVEALIQEVTGIGRIADAVSRVANRTNLLSLNAAIEAARAGQHGRGFAVVAQEIRTLADQSARSAQEITQIVGRVQHDITSTAAAVREFATSATDASSAVSQAAVRLDRMFTLTGEMAEVVSQTAGAAEVQASYATDLSNTVSEMNESIQEISTLAKAMGESHSSSAVEKGQAALNRLRFGGRTEWALELSLEAQREAESILDEAVQSKRVTLDDLLDLSYTEITGSQVSRLRRLFDVSRVPTHGFEPPKYFTRGDEAVDAQLIAMIDRYLAKAQGKILSIGAVDLNGFAVAMPSAACQAWTGDPGKDNAKNRIKRIYDDPVGLRSARVGLGSADLAPRRASRKQFGPAVEKQAPVGTSLMQIYATDTGVTVADLAVPVHVQGRLFGALRVGLLVGE